MKSSSESYTAEVRLCPSSGILQKSIPKWRPTSFFQNKRENTKPWPEFGSTFFGTKTGVKTANATFLALIFRVESQSKLMLWTAYDLWNLQRPVLNPTNLGGEQASGQGSENEWLPWGTEYTSQTQKVSDLLRFSTRMGGYWRWQCATMSLDLGYRFQPYVGDCDGGKLQFRIDCENLGAHPILAGRSRIDVTVTNTLFLTTFSNTMSRFETSISMLDSMAFNQLPIYFWYKHG